MLRTARVVLQRRLPREVVNIIIDYAFPLHWIVKKSPKNWDRVGLLLVHGIVHPHELSSRYMSGNVALSAMTNCRMLNARTLAIVKGDAFFNTLMFINDGWAFAVKSMMLGTLDDLRALLEFVLRNTRDSISVVGEFAWNVVSNRTLREEHIGIVYDCVNNKSFLGRKCLNDNDRFLRMFWDRNNALARKHFGGLGMWNYITGISREEVLSMCNDEQRALFLRDIEEKRDVFLSFGQLTEDVVKSAQHYEMRRISENTTLSLEFLSLRRGWNVRSLMSCWGTRIIPHFSHDDLPMLAHNKEIFFQVHSSIKTSRVIWETLITEHLTTEADFRRLDDSMWTNKAFCLALRDNPPIMTDWIMKKADIGPQDVGDVWRVTECALVGRLDWRGWNWDNISLYGRFSWAFVEKTLHEIPWNRVNLSWRIESQCGRQ